MRLVLPVGPVLRARLRPRALPAAGGATRGVGVGGVAQAGRRARLGDGRRLGRGLAVLRLATVLATVLATAVVPAEDVAQGRADDAAECPLGAAPVQDGDLELGSGQLGRPTVAGTG